MIIYFPPKQDRYGKGGNILHIMRDLGTPGGRIFIVIKVLIYIEQ